MTPNLLVKYKKEIVPELIKEFGYKSAMQAPKIVKMTINVGVGKFLKEPNFVENVEKNLAKITGQKPVRTKAKIAISNFKIRAGMEIGVAVTLRGPRMWYFLEKFIKVTLPRLRDFQGLSEKSFDRQGNFSVGLKENLAFPEVKAGDVDKIHGLEVSVHTTAANREEGLFLLKKLGFPFAKK